jgi:hypothetical protein
VSDDFFSGESAPVRRKRHPIRNIIVTLVILAALLIPGYFVAESLARSAATGYVQVGVQKELDVTNLSDVHVGLGKGSIILQVLQRKIKHMTVDIDKFSTDTITGSAVFTASGVPLNTTDPVTKMSIDVTIDPDSLTSMVARASGSPNATVALEGKNIRIGTSVKLLGITVPASVDLVPTASRGLLVFTPTAITVNKKTYTVAALKASPIGGLVGGLLKARSECVASSLPRDLALTNVAVSNDSLVVTVEGKGVALSGLSTKGSCVVG